MTDSSITVGRSLKTRHVLFPAHLSYQALATIEYSSVQSANKKSQSCLSPLTSQKQRTKVAMDERRKRLLSSLNSRMSTPSIQKTFTIGEPVPPTKDFFKVKSESYSLQSQALFLGAQDRSRGQVLIDRKFHEVRQPQQAPRMINYSKSQANVVKNVYTHQANMFSSTYYFSQTHPDLIPSFKNESKVLTPKSQSNFFLSNTGLGDF